MSDLVEFLRARLDEDEATARAAAREMDGESWDAYFIFREGISISTDGPVDERDGYISHHEETTHISRHDPARVLREVEAKRRIVREVCIVRQVMRATDRPGVREPVEEWSPLDSWETEVTVKALAAVYSNHPDYRDEWKP